MMSGSSARDMLSDDVSRLRDYRDHHADWARE
jgi:hypothetical protein